MLMMRLQHNHETRYTLFEKTLEKSYITLMKCNTCAKQLASYKELLAKLWAIHASVLHASVKFKSSCTIYRYKSSNILNLPSWPYLISKVLVAYHLIIVVKMFYELLYIIQVKAFLLKSFTFLAFLT